MLIYKKDHLRVEPIGPKTATIGIVGEAPGEKEVEVGKPFVGPAGNLLSELMQSAGIIRSECYITNVVKERPPKTSKKSNDISTFIKFKKSVVETTSEFDRYLEELKEELSNTSCNVFVAMGNISLYALTGIENPKITSRRGSVYECTLVPGRKVVACIHPAACIYTGKRDPGAVYLWKHLIIHDLIKAKEESEDRVIKRDPYNYMIEPSFNDCINTLRHIKTEVSVVAFDIEVMNLEVSCISFAFRGNPNTSISIPFIKSNSSYFTVDQEADIWFLIAEILSDNSIVKIGQNLVFDTQFLFKKYGIITRGPIFDTMIAQGIISPDFPKGLDFITSIYTNEPYYKDEGKKHIRVGTTDSNFWLYNAKDSAVCLTAMNKQKDELQRLRNTEKFDRHCKLIEPLVYMSERGIRVDIDNLRKESERVGERIEELSEKLNRICGYDINYNSPKQLVEYLYFKKGYSVQRSRKTGNPTTDEKALAKLAIAGVVEASILLEIRKLTKLKSTYFDVKLDDDNRIRSSYNPVGAADSGRLSSSKTIWETGMNMQNIPPAMKKLLLFDEGYVGYEIDLEQAENRIVAYIAPEPVMIEAFENGIDIHSRTASLIFNKPIEEVTNEIGKCPICNNPETCGHKGDRFWGKKSNHSFNYGLGPYKFAESIGVSNRIGRQIREAYLSKYPGITRFWQRIQETLRRGRILENLYGSKRLFMNRWGQELFREAYSYIPQSTVADIINDRGLIHIYYNQDKYKEVELLNQVHDSIVFQIPLSLSWRKHAEILLSIKKSLEVTLICNQYEFIIPCALSIGRNMGELKSVSWDSVERLEKNLETAWNIVSK